MSGSAAVHEFPRAATEKFSTDCYTSQAFLDDEIASVFLQTWLVVRANRSCRTRGDCLLVDEFGQSILLVRGQDRVVRAFRNACRHRGTRLARGYLTLAASLYILREDFGLLEPFQKGVRAAGKQAIHFHREERPLAYLHGVIDRYIACGRE